MTASDYPVSYAIVWDLETVPDLEAFGRMQGTPDLEPTEAEAQMSEKFQKLPLHKIVCIGALMALRSSGPWRVRSLGAPHELRPQLVSFNGHSYDLPVLRYRAMVNHVPAPGLSRRPYFSRYTDDALDLCDGYCQTNLKSCWLRTSRMSHPGTSNGRAHGAVST